ncbi:hypothetical protein SAMN07250955_104132 [Arboricoccus pini]|uniref:Lipoprotein n=2 Tax=Arboricoccus pini TaxID=1963835 RepID=A0A212QYE8_9PROT|nr:hypothetical protein SAMN07250955_104132 [Arboricoccus pini]
MRRPIGKIKLFPYLICSARRKIGTLCLAALTLAACAGSPDVLLGPGADAQAGGRALLTAAANGPVPMLVDRMPATDDAVLTEDELAGWAADGVRNWTRVTFKPSSNASGGTRLVLRFTELEAFSPNDACREPGGASVGHERRPPRLWAYLCEGDQALSSTTGTAAGSDAQSLHRVVLAVTRRLVPGDDYGRGPPGIGMFGGVGFGAGSGGWSGSGVGIGLGF